jgi:CRISPR-associated protein Cmr3
MSHTTFRFEPLDTLFFREARPHGSAGGSELASLFPPPARTVAGAVRTFIGDSQNIDWAEFNKEHPLSRQIGYGDDLGPLRFSGPWLSRGGRRLYPAPLFLLAAGEANHRNVVRLRIGGAVECDLGKVHLPELPPGNAGAKPLDSAWLDGRELANVLAGGIPAANRLVGTSDLYCEEPRLGIARVNATRTAAESLLYQTRHIRPHRDIAIEVDAEGAQRVSAHAPGLVRFGGEGRLAAVGLADNGESFPACPELKKGETRGLILVLLTPALFGGERWHPQEFSGPDPDGAWHGTVNGVALTLRAAVIGKARREGGWDMAARQPRAVKSLIPAGSAYYCTVDSGDIEGALRALHGSRIGADTTLGYGQIACGLWNRNEYPQEE